MTDGSANRTLGWLLLIAVFVGSAFLDPWSLSQRDATSVEFHVAMLVRYGQAVVIGLAFLQLLVGILLAHHVTGTANVRLASLLAVAGTLLYIPAYAIYIFWQPAAWLVAVAAVLNVASFVLLLPARFNPALGVAPRAAIGILCFGLLVDVFMALSVTSLRAFYPGWVEDPDGVAMRMVRLARAAMIALPLLSLHYAELRAASRPVPRLLEWAGPVFVFGAATMPLILVLAAAVWMPFKYLLALPANAVVVGVAAGVYLAWRGKAWPVLLGWLAVFVSMEVGLFMGLYAFDGPLPDPTFIGAYNDYARRLNRLGHAYVIVFGVVLLALCRDVHGGMLGKWLVGIGGVVALAVMMLLAIGLLHPLALSVGPAIVAVGVVVGLRERLAGTTNNTNQTNKHE